MNRPPDPLESLLRAAAEAETADATAASAREFEEPPFGMETRVLAAWRESAAAQQAAAAAVPGLGRLPLGFLWRAVACACAVTAAAVALNVQHFADTQSTENSGTYGELAMVDTVIAQSLEP